jgi:hypothetical protein
MLLAGNCDIDVHQLQQSNEIGLHYMQRLMYINATQVTKNEKRIKARRLQ